MVESCHSGLRPLVDLEGVGFHCREDGGGRRFQLLGMEKDGADGGSWLELN